MRPILRCHSCGRVVAWKATCAHCAKASRALASAASSESDIRSRLYPGAEYVSLVRGDPNSGPSVRDPAASTQRRSSLFYPPDDRRGLVLDGRYRVLERVAAGGTATVYRGRDLLLGKDVAMKIMHEVLADDEAIIERFQREAHTAQRLRHRNIVRAFDHGRSHGLHYIVMEHVPGPSLKTLIANEAPLDPARAIGITLQILEGARFIHDHGIIHRDLKPANVILNGRGLAKITDFGIASSGGADITPAGSFLGTVHYLAPERVTCVAATEASDVYSIGIILYELLTGCLPFDGELVATVALRHLNESPLPPGCVNGAIPPQLNAIVLRALEKSPQARLADCTAFVTALRRGPCSPPTTSMLPAVTPGPAVVADAA